MRVLHIFWRVLRTTVIGGPASIITLLARIANADGEVMMAGTGALLTGALWRPTEQAPNAVSPKRMSIALPRISSFNRKPEDRASCADASAHVQRPYI